jgi:hypothetical protein
MVKVDWDFRDVDWAEMEKDFQKFARENPEHPAVIKAIACRMATRKNGEPSQCEKDWLDLALKKPNHPRVILVRKVAGHLKDGREAVAEKGNAQPFSQDDSQPHESNVEVLQPTPAPESEGKFPKLSDHQRKQVYDDLVEHLRITKAFKLFGSIKGSDGKPN